MKSLRHRNSKSRVALISAAATFGALCLGTISLANAEGRPPGTQVFTKYGISIAGIPVGNARVTTRFNGSSYSIVANGRTAGVSRLVSDGKGTLTTSGKIRRGRVLPSNFAMDTVDDKLVTHVRMGMTNQNIVKLVAVPPLAKRPDRIPVGRQHYRNILDPLSAFMVPLDTDGRIVPTQACDRRIPVFDGWQRFDVQLSFKEKKNVRLGGNDGYSGPVVICKARYIPVAGHRPTRRTTVYLANNKNMEMWLAPVEGVPVLVPVHIKIGTMVGPLTLSTRIFTAEAGDTKRASAN
ncbi:MAG: DUF3108 domain-containing protein [Pseudomonadota bacterium]